MFTNYLNVQFFIKILLLAYIDCTFAVTTYQSCKLLSNPVEDYVYAMPLLPNIYPFKVQKKCVRVNPLIVGGVNATHGEFPHMLAVGFKTSDNITHWLCGGSLITEKYVITAAHCSETRWGKPTFVRLGTLFVNSTKNAEVKISKVIIHPQYKPPSVYNDIALLKLKDAIKLNDYIQSVCLHTVITMNPNTIAVATGWGRVSFGGESSPTLLKTTLKIVSNSECSKHYHSTTQLQNGIAESMFCAVGYRNPSQDTCQGDSGGPVQTLVEGNECIQQLVGITSFGKSCGSGLPAVYTKVAYYVKWIEYVVSISDT